MAADPEDGVDGPLGYAKLLHDTRDLVAKQVANVALLRFGGRTACGSSSAPSSLRIRSAFRAVLQRHDLAGRHAVGGRAVAYGEDGASDRLGHALGLSGFPTEVTINGQTFPRTAPQYLEGHVMASAPRRPPGHLHHPLKFARQQAVKLLGTRQAIAQCLHVNTRLDILVECSCGLLPQTEHRLLKLEQLGVSVKVDRCHHGHRGQQLGKGAVGLCVEGRPHLLINVVRGMLANQVIQLTA